jgi:hypothetical protein
LNGNLTHAALITDPLNSTGIAYDGTFFYVDNGGDFNTASPSIAVYTASGTFVRRFSLTGYTGVFTGEDLSFDYATVLSPEPGSIVLLGSGLVGLALWRRRRAS